MRALANAIGCGTMSLYSYVKNKEDLVDAIVEALITRSTLPALAAQNFDSWQDLARALALGYRELAARYPHAHELLALAPYDRGASTAHIVTLAEGLRRAGLGVEQSYEVLGALDAYVTGFLLVSVRADTGRETSTLKEAPELRRLRSAETFESGLEVFIRGFEQIFAERATAAQ